VQAARRVFKTDSSLKVLVGGLIVPDRLWKLGGACGTLGGRPAPGRLGEGLLLMEQLTQENEMSKIMRVCVLVASLMSLFGVMSSSAGAVTWSNDGGTSFTATGGPRTLSGGGLSLICTSSDATGTAATGPFTGAVWSAMTVTVRATGCTIAGIPTAQHCTYTFTATAQPVPPVTNGISHTTCVLSQGATKICHIEGTEAAHYIGHTDPRLTLTHSTTLTATNVPPGNCPLGHGSPVTASHYTVTLTSPVPPTITRRP
jgi:hypothetical protein